ATADFELRRRQFGPFGECRSLEEVVGDRATGRGGIFFPREGRAGRTERRLARRTVRAWHRSALRDGCVARRRECVAADAEQNAPHLTGKAGKGAPPGSAVDRNERRLELRGQ